VSRQEHWRPTHDDPLFILAMDHRDSFGTTLFAVKNDAPTAAQRASMAQAKSLIYRGLTQAAPKLRRGRAGVLVDEQYAPDVVNEAMRDPIVLAIPVEASGHEWFTLQWPESWLDHVHRIAPNYVKVLVRDNPAFDANERRAQFDQLTQVSKALESIGVPMLYELLVPATDEQLASLGGPARDAVERYDRDVRPELVVRVIADNQDAGIEPTLWKVEGLDTVDSARAVAAQAQTGNRDTNLIVLGRDAPVDRLDRWLQVASQVDAFVGFAIGRSIWEDPIRDWVNHGLGDQATADHISNAYLAFADQWGQDDDQ
jgi:myo-inositol catabolism protein IolC